MSTSRLAADASSRIASEPRQPFVQAVSAAAPGARTVAAKLFAVLEAFASEAPTRGLSLTDLAARARLPMSTAHRIVGELVRWDAIIKSADGRYSIGLRLWELGVLTPASQVLRKEALPYLEDLHALAHDEVILAVMDGSETVCIECFSRHRSARSSVSVGSRRPAHSSAAGLVLLAHSQDAARKLYQSDADSVVDLHAANSDPQFSRSLAHIRLEGVARLSSVDSGDKSSAVAAPIRNRSGTVLGAVSVSISAGLTTAAYDELVRLAARGISSAMGYVSRSRRTDSIA